MLSSKRKSSSLAGTARTAASGQQQPRKGAFAYPREREGRCRPVLRQRPARRQLRDRDGSRASAGGGRWPPSLAHRADGGNSASRLRCSSGS